MSYDVFARYYDALTANVNYEEMADYLCALLKKEGQMCIRDRALARPDVCVQGYGAADAAAPPDPLAAEDGNR